jgi:hypothetical protein
MFTGTEVPTGHLPAKDHEQSRSQRSKDDCGSSEHKSRARDPLGVARSHRLGNLADPAAVDTHASDALGEVKD